MKHGGTPLHWSSSREVLLELIDRGCDVNAVNFEGKTALHVMVERNRLECVVALLSHETEVDVRDRDGNTPLHLAIAKKLVPMVQCLVVFGCDIDMANRDGQTPRHLVGKDASGGPEDMILYILHSVGALRCAPNSSCPLGCNHLGTYNGIPPAQPESVENREQIYQVLASNSSSSAAAAAAAQTASGSRPSRSGSLINSLVSLSGSSSGSSAESTAATLVDVSAEQKGRNVMDALLGMFTNKVHASTKNGEWSRARMNNAIFLLRFLNASVSVAQNYRRSSRQSAPSRCAPVASRVTRVHRRAAHPQPPRAAGFSAWTAAAFVA